MKQGRKKKKQRKEASRASGNPFPYSRKAITVRRAKQDVSHRSPWIGA
jgi:hypothetical protein